MPQHRSHRRRPWHRRVWKVLTRLLIPRPAYQIDPPATPLRSPTAGPRPKSDRAATQVVAAWLAALFALPAWMEPIRNVFRNRKLSGLLTALLLIPIPVFATEISFSGNTWQIADPPTTDWSGWNFGTGNDAVNGVLVLTPPTSTTLVDETKTIVITGTFHSDASPATPRITLFNYDITSLFFGSGITGLVDIRASPQEVIGSDAIVVENNQFVGPQSPQAFPNGLTVANPLVLQNTDYLLTVTISISGNGTFSSSPNSLVSMTFK